MVDRQKRLFAQRRRKTMRVRRKLRGQEGRPRLSVFRSNKNISVQVIDDERGHTLAAASSLDKGLVGELQGKNKTDIAVRVGQEIASKAKEAGVTSVAFDRGSYQYHGRVKALADAAREGGLEF